MTFDSHKNHTNTTRHLLQTWKITKHNLKIWERPNLSGSTILPTKATFTKLQTPIKRFKNDPRSIFNNCTLYYHERQKVPHIL